MKLIHFEPNEIHNAIVLPMTNGSLKQQSIVNALFRFLADVLEIEAK